MVMLRSLMVPAWARYLRDRRVDIADLLARHDIPLDVANEQTCPIRSDTLRALGDDLAVRAKDPLLGLHAALAQPRGAYGVVEYLARNAPDVRAIIEELVRFGRLVNDHLDVRFDPESGVLEQRILHEAACLGAQGNLFSLAHQLSIARDATGRALVPESVSFAHAGPFTHPDLVRFFGTRNITTGTGANSIVLSRAVLSAPNPTHDPRLLDLLEERAVALREDLPTDDVVDACRRAVLSRLTDGEPTARVVARDVGLGERTLHRRLQTHGTSFGAIVDDLRLALAKERLADASVRVADVADALGYSDERAFARAFRRWTSRSPSEWRAALSGSEAPL